MTLDVVYPELRHLQRYAPNLVLDLGYAPGFGVPWEQHPLFAEHHFGGLDDHGYLVAFLELEMLSRGTCDH